MIPIRYNLRSLIVRKTSNLLAIFGVALVVFVLAAALMLSAGIRKTLASSGSDDTAIVIRKGSEAELASSIEDPMVGLVISQPGVAQFNGRAAGVSESVLVVALEKLGAAGFTNVQVRGISPDAAMLQRPIRIVKGREAKPGSDEVIIGRRLDGRFRGLELGKSFELRRNRPATVVGVFSADGASYESEVWADQDTLRSAFGRNGIVSSVRVRLTSSTAFESFRASVEQDKRMGLEALTERKYYERLSEGTSLFITILGSVIAVFCSLGAMIGAMITMYGAVANRMREIGTLRALGFPRGQVLLSFLIESLMLAAVGGVIGCIAALAIGSVEISMMNFASWSEVVFRLDATPQALGIALGCAGFMGLIGGALPAIRAASVSALAAMRG
ncbi:MAG TPA: ABC transporter permease [Polyangiaceae bacterium]